MEIRPFSLSKLNRKIHIHDEWTNFCSLSMNLLAALPTSLKKQISRALTPRRVNATPDDLFINEFWGRNV